MTVKISQREPDKDTMEQHVYFKYGVVDVSTYKDSYGGTYMRIINNKSQVHTIRLDYFDVEIHSFM